MAKDELTAKQEAFALAYVETGNAAEAYRRAYDVKAATTHSSIYVAASRLMDNPKVMLRVADLQKQAAEMCIYTVRDAFEEYEAARKLAMSETASNPSAAVSAVNGKVKLFGLEAPARSRVEHTGKDGGPIQSEEVTPLERVNRRIAGLASRIRPDADPIGTE
jgi:phage terminase small subunit